MEKLFFWDMADEDVFIHCCPCEEMLHPNAALVVRPEQAAYLNLGGKYTRWVYSEGTYSIGLGDCRTIDEILAARTAGEQGLIEIRPEICFFDLRKHRIEGKPFRLSTKAGTMKVQLFYELRIVEPEEIMKTAFKHAESVGLDSPLLSGITGQISDWLTGYLRDLLKDIPDEEIEDESRARLERSLPEIERKTSAKLEMKYSGFTMEQLSFTADWFPALKCAVCGVAVMRGAKYCENGHLLNWCPTCMEAVEADWFACKKGHPLLWCGKCDRFVAVLKGRFCPEGHGACYPRF